jgi:hypothetical protein
VPVDRGGARSDLGVVDSLVVAERREGFDMTGMLEPAVGDDVVVQMRAPSQSVSAHVRSDAHFWRASPGVRSGQ